MHVAVVNGLTCLEVGWVSSQMTRVTEEYPGLTYMVVRSFRHSRRASLDVQVLFKPLLVIYLLISYWPKQAIWPTQREGVEIQTPLLDGKI